MRYVFSVPVYVYDVLRRFEDVSVKYVDDSILIIRRGLGVSKEVVSGRADVVVGVDEWGRVVNVEIDFVDYYHVDKDGAQKILRKARW
jgi:hypothetical protein